MHRRSCSCSSRRRAGKSSRPRTGYFGTSVLVGDGAVGTPSFSFGSDTNTGFYSGGADQISVTAGGTNTGFIGSSNWTIGGAAGNVYFGTGQDAALVRDAANTLALRNGTNAQVFRVYNTFTDASNYEMGFMRWLTNGFQIGTTFAGTGSIRPVQCLTGNSVRWEVSAVAGHLIGVNGGRVMDVTSSTSVSADSNQTYTAAGVIGGTITRTGITANRTDAMPTAAAIVAAIPGCVVGTTFEFVLNNNDDTNTVTLNGANTGVTYEGTATALAVGDAWLFRVVVTSITGGSEAVTVYQIAK